MITWVNLQQKIKSIFEDSFVSYYADVMEKDGNGWNWVLSFHNIENEYNKIIHTKLIFKLTDDKQGLRKNEFLYLKELNCKYVLKQFTNLEDMQKKIEDIFAYDKFGENLLSLSRFTVNTTQQLNSHLYKKGKEGLTFFDFKYDHAKEVKSCQDMDFDFAFNLNNKYDFQLKIHKKGNSFQLLFKYLDDIDVVELDDLHGLVGAVCLYIDREFN